MISIDRIKTESPPAQPVLQNLKKPVLERIVHAFIFDMDGTLFDSERVCADVWKMAERKFGFTGSEAMLLKTTGARPADPIALYTEFFGDEQLARDVYEFRMGEMRRIRTEGPPPEMKPGARETLTALWSAGIPTALATSSPMESVDRLFGGAGLVPQFSAVVTGCELPPGRGKPCPDIFIEAARRIGVHPAYCVVAEDSPNGVRAGAASGAFTVLVPDIIQPDEEIKSLADAILPSLLGLTSLPCLSVVCPVQ